MALSFGKPVVMPGLGCLPELVDDTMGLLYDPKERHALRDALVEIRGRDLKAAEASAMNRARTLDWDSIAGRLGQLYQG